MRKLTKLSFIAILAFAVIAVMSCDNSTSPPDLGTGGDPTLKAAPASVSFSGNHNVGNISFTPVPGASYHRFWIRHTGNGILQTELPSHITVTQEPTLLHINHETLGNSPGFAWYTPRTTAGFQFGVSAMCSVNIGIMSAITWSAPTPAFPLPW